MILRVLQVKFSIITNFKTVTLMLDLEGTRSSEEILLEVSLLDWCLIVECAGPATSYDEAVLTLWEFGGVIRFCNTDGSICLSRL